MDSSIKLGATTGEPLLNINLYRRLIGRLIYLTTTWPNIAFTMNKLIHFLSIPTNRHLALIHWVLWFIKDSPGTHHQIFAKSPHTLTLIGLIILTLGNQILVLFIHWILSNLMVIQETNYYIKILMWSWVSNTCSKIYNLWVITCVTLLWQSSHNTYFS